MHFPFTPNHVQLISDCYPPQAALCSTAPQYRPNSQELSRLVYYAANKTGKINKVSAELEKRVKAESRKSQAGNIRSRASLLITLAIFKALATECRRDMSLLSSSLLSCVHIALLALPSDLELAARTASVFTAWTTYTDGHLIGADRNVTQDYLSVLKIFADMSKVQSKSNDHEDRNRTRLVGLAVLDGVVSSEALFNASPCFKDQVDIIVPAILVTICQAECSVLEHQAFLMKDKQVSPYLPKTRPVAERRATSVHLHKDGENGPSFSDVVDAALHAFSSLVGQSHGAQLGLVMQAAFDSLDVTHGWEQVDHCRWLAQASADWAQYQYRYAIPSRLVERLLESQDTPSTAHSLATLTAMVTTVFVSPTPLVNLSTSDMVSNLISLVLRRTALDPDDPLLPALVRSMASLGTHVYYADQIQDLAGEMISRLTAIEAGGVGIRGKSGNSKKRSQAIRCLLAGLLGLIHVADSNQPKHTGGPEVQRSSPTFLPIVGADSSAAEHTYRHVHPSRRTKVSPEVWVDTLTLLCDGDYAVRADYALTLLSYIEFEIPRKGDRKDADGVKRLQSLSEGPARHTTTAAAILFGDSVTRFLNALHAYIYALSTSSCLGTTPSSVTSTNSTSPSPSPSNGGDLATMNVIPPTPTDSRLGLAEGKGHRDSVEDEVTGTSNLHDSPLHSESQSRRSTMFGPRSRQVSSLSHMINFFPVTSSSTTSSSSATLSDYTNILAVLTLIHEQLPIRSLFTSVPMLSALEQDLQGNFGKHTDVQRLNVIREVLTRVWLAIGRIWDCQPLVEAAEQILSAMLYPSNLPARSQLKPGMLSSPREAVEFSGIESAPSSVLVDGVAVGQALAALSANRNIQEVTGLDNEKLLARLSKKWTAEQALKDSLEIRPSPDAFRAVSLLKVTPTLMNIDNVSLQSLGRVNRAVGVTELREALEGRSSVSNSALVNNRPASISTLDHASSFLSGEAGLSNHMGPTPKPRGHIKKKLPGDVRDALNKLGVGGGPRSNGVAQRSSFSMQRTEMQARTLVGLQQ